MIVRLALSKGLRSTRSLSTVTRPDLEVGSLTRGFRLKSIDFIEPLHSHVLQFVHEMSNAEYLHIAKDDPTNVFCLMFRTPPSDDTGVAHILEHTTLCGSQRYPVRDPFFKMLNRSVSTFMNAMTGPDFTMYPFATANWQDYRNLMDVYMDAVFFPLLRKEDFYQEGWRLDHKVTGDVQSAVEIKGVVFNEMKGALSDGDTLFRAKWQKAMYENSPYSFESGGNPLDIPKLSFEELVEFHRRHYRPSNARIFTYGSTPVTEHLALLDFHLQRVEIGTGSVHIPDLPMPQAVRRVVDYGPVDPLLPEDRQTKWLYSFAASRHTDAFETFVVQIISKLLLQGPGSPLYKALIESQIGSEYAPGTGFNATSNQTVVSFGLQGLSSTAVDVARRALLQALSHTVQNGFAAERLDALLAQIELSLKHRTSDFGLGLLWAIYDSWNHGADPVSYLSIDRNVAQLNSAIARNRFYLQEKVAQYFTMDSNTPKRYQMDFILEPSANYSQRLKEREANLVSSLSSKLSAEDHARISSANLQLLDKQLDESKASEDLIEKLPKIEIANLSKKVKEFKIGKLHPSTRVWQRVTDTNGVCYAQFQFDLAGLSPNLLPLVPLWCELVTNVGTLGATAAEMDQRVRSKTGGISFSPLILASKDTDDVNLAVVLSGHCLDRHEQAMVDLMREFVTRVDFSKYTTQLQVHLQRAANDAVSSVAERGSRLAMISAAAATGRPFAYVGQLWNGMEALELTVKLARDAQSLLLPDLMQQISTFVANSYQKSLVHHDGKASIAGVSSFAVELASNSDFGRTSSLYLSHPEADLYVETAMDTGYSGMSLRGPFYAEAQRSASVSLLAQIISSGHIHPTVREKGGAYGGGAQYSALEGHWAFYSYRDPRPFDSVKVFKDSFKSFLRKLENDKVTPRMLEEAKLTLLKHNDAPVSAFNEGLLEFRYGITAEERQERRALTYSQQVSDLQNACEMLSKNLDKAKVAVLSPKENCVDASYRHKVLAI